MSDDLSDKDTERLVEMLEWYESKGWTKNVEQVRSELESRDTADLSESGDSDLTHVAQAGESDSVDSDSIEVPVARVYSDRLPNCPDTDEYYDDLSSRSTADLKESAEYLRENGFAEDAAADMETVIEHRE